MKNLIQADEEISRRITGTVRDFLITSLSEEGNGAAV